MNEWCIYIALLLCIAIHPKRLQSCGGGGLSSTTTSVQHPLGWYDGSHSTTAPVRSPHNSYRWRGERVIEPIKWMGIIRRPWLIRASRGNLARTPGTNEQMSLVTKWLKHLAQNWHMTQRCPHGYCSYSSSFWSVLLSLGRYISHRFLLVLNQIQISSTVKITFIWMHQRAIACVN